MATPPPDGFYTTDEFLSDPEKFSAFAGAIPARKRHLYEGILVERGRCSLVHAKVVDRRHTPEKQLQAHLVAEGKIDPPKPPKPKKPKRKLKSHKQRRVIGRLEEMDDIPLLNLATLWGLTNPEIRLYCEKFGVKLYTGARKEGMIQKIKDSGHYLKIRK